MEPQKKVRCAIYTRKSTDEGLEKEFNTLEAQREAGENYIKSFKHQGWEALPDHYDDGGFSGGNLKRPALQQLLKDVEKGKVDMIVVYKIEVLKTRLVEAEEAYHKLMIGEKEVSVSVGSFGSTTYNQASRTALEGYISSLKSQIAAAEGTPTCCRRIMKVSF